MLETELKAIDYHQDVENISLNPMKHEQQRCQWQRNKFLLYFN